MLAAPVAPFFISRLKIMAKDPAYPMYAQDIDMDTASWSCNAFGAYVRLLNYSWINGGLPDDVDELARIARLDGGNFKKCWSKWIWGKFQKVDGVLVNRRMEEEREKREIYRKSQQLKGIKSGERRQPKVNRGSTGVQPGRQPRRQPKGNLSLSLSFSLSLAKHLLPEDIKDIIIEKSWNGFIEMRERIKKPLTERAVELIGITLSQFHAKGQDINKCLDQSVVKNYQDVYEVKEDGNGASRGYSQRNGTSGIGADAETASKYNGLGEEPISS
jgi:uncharacterized protein YdaU (DUF1376 family)